MSRSTVARLAVRPHRSEAEGEGVEPPTAEATPVFEAGYRAGGSPSEVGGTRHRADLLVAAKPLSLESNETTALL